MKVPEEGNTIYALTLPPTLLTNTDTNQNKYIPSPTVHLVELTSILYGD